MLSGMSPLSIIVILVIVVLLFGTKKLRGKAMSDENDKDDNVIEAESKEEKEK